MAESLISAETARERAAAYGLVERNLREMIEKNGPDFDPEMMLVFASGQVRCYEALAAALSAPTLFSAPSASSDDTDEAGKLRRIIAEWAWESRMSGGIDADDLQHRVEQAGINLDAEFDAIERGDDEEDSQ
jgi:hypothetical protein